MGKREYEVLWNYYYGFGKSSIVSVDTIRSLDNHGIIKKIYEVIDNDYNETWYMIRDVKEKSYILKSKWGSLYAINIMNEFRDKYVFYKITTELIKIYDNGVYPIVFKVNNTSFSEYYDEKKNISKAFFNCYYCCINNEYKTIRKYNNKVETAIFNNEEDAIYWCSDYSITKDKILENNIRPFNLKERVYNYEF